MTNTQLKTFFHSNYEQLCNKAHRYINNTDICEDIVQECFIKYWELYESNKPIEKPLAYLNTAIRNSCLNYIKSQKSIDFIESEDFISGIEDESPETDEREVEPEEIIEQALSLLPHKCRQIFEMSRIQDKTYKQIAEELNISIKTVENQMGKAIKIIREFVSTNPTLFTFLLLHFNIYA